MPADSLEHLAYDTAVRALDKQEAVLNEIRSRTGALLAASALGASFLGRDAFRDPSLALALIAMASFVISVGASVFVLLPRKNVFVFALSGVWLYEGLFAFHEDLPEAHRRLTYDLERIWASNDARLQPLFRAYRVGASALVVEILVLVALVSDNLT